MSLRKRKPSLYQIKVPLYEQSIWLALELDALKHFGGNLDEMSDGYEGVVWLLEEKDQYFVVMFLQNKDINTVAHESLHAAWRTLDAVGIEVESDNHEALAYLVGYVTEKVWEAIQKEASIGDSV